MQTILRSICAAVAVLGFVTSASAQTPLVAGQVIEFDVANPGNKVSGSTTTLRPESNISFEYRVNGSTTPIPADKYAPCAAGATAPALVCRLVPPTLVSGTHTIEVRAFVSPAETGIGATAYSQTLGVAMLIVTMPSVPSNLRVVTPTP